MTDIQLDNLARSRAHDNLTDGVILLQDAVKMLVDMYKDGQKDAPKWVKVSEIKPPNGERVLILKRTGHTMIATYYVVDQFNRPDMFVGEGGAHYDITWVDYWMNIPKPPIDGGNQ